MLVNPQESSNSPFSFEDMEKSAFSLYRKYLMSLNYAMPPLSWIYVFLHISWPS